MHHLVAAIEGLLHVDVQMPTSRISDWPWDQRRSDGVRRRQKSTAPPEMTAAPRGNKGADGTFGESDGEVLCAEYSSA
jgi:hypothetical protein